MSDIYKEQKFIGLCVFFFLLVNFPLLGIFDKEVAIAHIPLLIFYIAFVWLIGLGTSITPASNVPVPTTQTKIRIPLNRP